MRSPVDTIKVFCCTAREKYLVKRKVVNWNLLQKATHHRWIKTTARLQSHNKPVRIFRINKLVKSFMSNRF